ncbi:hypothetical protein LAZ67_13002538 [Cordylochernes scorpioides]|uniref:Secreted protein n=1 Tax=Cordylochernes scorpioides TaxID=51811 RepID=A0ABY6L4P0_9ARAC|nr:hypothetical protein LAZ67_13002538 [Cordylochernes scorpioides]
MNVKRIVRTYLEPQLLAVGVSFALNCNHLLCFHTSLSEQQQCPLSWVCKAAALGLCQFSARLRTLLGMRICE